MSNIFLGYPPPKIRQFIEENYGPQINTTPLTFTAEEAGSTVKMAKNGALAPAVSLQTSTDGENWSDFTVGSTTITLANVGDKVYFRASEAGNTQMATSGSNYNYFVMTGKISASGNIMSLLDASCQLTSLENRNYAFCYLFVDCSSLTQAPELPSTTLAMGCYNLMFKGCLALTKTPELPATTLDNRCYAYMFFGCSALTQAPKILPATTLADYCYDEMFSGCTSLTQTPELPATTLADNCYAYMFSNCSSLTQAPELPATTLADYCYAWMFNGCTSPFDFSSKTSSEVSSLNTNNKIFGEWGRTLQVICSDGTITITTPVSDE